MFEVMRAHEVRYFFYIGGNDSSDTVRIVNEQADKANYSLRAIHIPKTIDNDLVINDHTPGYGSAARFVASAFMGVNQDNRALPGVYIGVVMGRHAGFLTAASAVAKKYPDDGPHLIYLPERAFDLDKFSEDVQRTFDEHGRCVVAVSEGISDKDGKAIITKLQEEVETDAHGNVQLSGTGALGDLLAQHVKKTTKIKRVRADTLGYLQRSFAGCVSDVDQREAREVAEKAVQFALWHDVDGSVVIKRTGNYSVDYELVPLGDIAAKTRHMPDEFINEAGNHVTDQFFLYVRPLMGSGMPEQYRIRAPKVDKLLKL
jgi:6-phosphofructokinase 1